MVPSITFADDHLIKAANALAHFALLDGQHTRPQDQLRGDRIEQELLVDVIR
jgi:hypothetical protein